MIPAETGLVSSSVRVRTPIDRSSEFRDEQMETVENGGLIGWRVEVIFIDREDGVLLRLVE